MGVVAVYKSYLGCIDIFLVAPFLVGIFYKKTSSRESFGNDMTHRSSLVSLRKRNVSTAIVLWIINTNGNDLGHAKMSRSFIFYTTRKVTCGKTFQPFRLVFGQTFFGFMEKFYRSLNSEKFLVRTVKQLIWIFSLTWLDISVFLSSIQVYIFCENAWHCDTLHVTQYSFLSFS